MSANAECNAMAMTQAASIMQVEIQASGVKATYATSKTTSFSINGCFSGIGCFSWLQNFNLPNFGTRASCRPLQVNQKRGPPAPSPESLRADSLIAPERRSCAANSGSGIHRNAPPLSLPLEVAPPPVSARPLLPPQVLADCPEGVRHVVSGCCNNASGSATVAEANDVTKAIDEVDEGVMEIDSETPWQYGHCSQASAGEEETEEKDKGENAAESTERAITSEDAATPEDPATKMQNRILLSLMQDAPRASVDIFNYDYFQQLRAQLRSSMSIANAAATHIKHIAAIKWLHYERMLRSDPSINSDLINPDGVLVATYVNTREGRPCFNANKKTIWRWHELIASIDDTTLLMHEGQPAYTPLQYVVNGPDWQLCPRRSIGITECRIRSLPNCLYITRRNGSSACLQMNWENGRIQAYEVGYIDNPVFFNIVV